MKKLLSAALLLLPVLCFCQQEPDTTGSNLTSEAAAALLAHHNKARAEVNVPPLAWSRKLAVYAQSWADTLASDCDFRHRQNSPYGENIFMANPSDQFNPVIASESWYQEKEKYTYAKIDDSNWMQTGHYTQMIWKKTTEVGIGMATCQNGNIIVVANYNPGGNMMGEHPY